MKRHNIGVEPTLLSQQIARLVEPANGLVSEGILLGPQRGSRANR